VGYSLSRFDEHFSGLAKPVTQSLFAIVIGLTVGALLLAVCGYNPLVGFHQLFESAFFTEIGLASTLSYAAILMLVGITFGLGMRAGLFNIGAEGQLMVGALAAVAVSTFSLPPGLHLLVGVIFAMLAGALWALPVAILRVKKGVHEVVSTIMLNWIAFYLCLYLVLGPLYKAGTHTSVQVQPSSRFPLLFGTLSTAIFAAILFAVIVYFIMWHTRLGCKIRAVGFDQESAHYMGINPGRAMMIGFIIGGLAAGLAGGAIVMGVPPDYAVFTELSNITGYGFAGIAVALIGRNHPLGTIFSAIFFGGLWSGKRAMQIYAGIPLEIVDIVIGIIVISAAIPELLSIIRRKIKGRSSR
jgi:simple sugar transport system permease protein